jgi:RimJ/RimL family protein N-acetyltransferase
MSGAIQTPRLVVRPTTEADRLDLHRLEQDADVMRYLNGGAPTALEPDTTLKASFLMPRGVDPGVWAIIESGAGGFVGWVSLKTDGDAAELGYRLHRKFWGRGYAVEAAAALVAHGFQHLGLRRISAQTMAVNLASRRVMERLGMQHARTFFVDYADPLPGSDQGEVEYVLTQEMWKADRNGRSHC